MTRLNVGVLISGRGSNLQALIEAAAEPDFPAEVVLVLSNRPDAQGLERAAAANIPTGVISHRDFAGRERFDAQLTTALAQAGVELVCLAGFMRLLTAGFVDHWAGRLINIHPSLLPAFPGLDTHARALAAGVKLHGCTVHHVRLEVDSGPIIGQAAVPVLPGDTPDALGARVLEVEHRLYPTCLRLVAAGHARLIGDQVVVEGAGPTAPALLNPGP